MIMIKKHNNCIFLLIKKQVKLSDNVFDKSIFYIIYILYIGYIKKTIYFLIKCINLIKNKKMK